VNQGGCAKATSDAVNYREMIHRAGRRYWDGLRVSPQRQYQTELAASGTRTEHLPALRWAEDVERR